MFKNFYRQFAWFLNYYKKNYLIGMLCLGLSYACAIIPPRILGSTTDLIVAGEISPALLRKNLLIIVALAFLGYLFNYVWGYKLFRASDEIDRLIHLRIFKRILKQGPHFFTENPAGSIMGKATNDVNALSDIAGYGAMALFDASVLPLLLLIVMFNISWRVTCLAILPFPILVIFAQKVGKKLYVYYDAAQRAFDEMNDSVLEGVSGIRIVRSYNLEEYEIQKFVAKADDLYTKNVRAAFYSQMYDPMTGIIPALAFVIAMAVGYFEIKAGRLSTGDLLGYSIYLNMLSWPMISIGEFLITAQQGSASMDRINNLLEAPLDVNDEDLTAPFPADLSLNIEKLSFAYPKSENGSEALKELSFSLEAGQSLGVVGPVGSGKTSLLRQFLHFYPLKEGQIFVGGIDLAKIKRQELTAALSYVPQQSFLFSQSIKENILLGASDELLASETCDDRLQEVVELADLTKDIRQFSAGLETPAGEKGIALSGGQKQRICIARALIKDSQILILDDCLSAVDALTEEHILRALRQERQGKITLISAHRLSAVKDADLILVLQEGRIVEKGTHQELLAQGKWYAEQFHKQQMELKEKQAKAAVKTTIQDE